MKKKGTRKPWRIEKMAKVTDDWYPNFEDNTVRVMCFEELRQDGFRVAVWGADDFGMEKYYTDKSEAKAMYERLDSPLSAVYLRDLGFQNA